MNRMARRLEGSTEAYVEVCKVGVHPWDFFLWPRYKKELLEINKFLNYYYYYLLLLSLLLFIIIVIIIIIITIIIITAIEFSRWQQSLH
jgi:hypothetical protein